MSLLTDAILQPSKDLQAVSYCEVVEPLNFWIFLFLTLIPSFIISGIFTIYQRKQKAIEKILLETQNPEINKR